eukprot:Skav225146  [mRNA]  locus=scaffold1056:222214:226752:- [translate_table: standard]
MADYDYRTALHLASSNGHLETCVFLLREGRVDPNPLDRFLNTPLDDAIRHGHKDIVELLMKYKGRPSDDDEYLSTVRDDFLKKMEEEKARKDTDKLENELKTHRLSDVMNRLSRLASDMEDDIHHFKNAASNVRYALCRILHMSMFLQDDSSRSRAGYDKLAHDMEEGNLTTQKLVTLLERDVKQLDSSASRVLKHIAGELQPWLNAATNNAHTRGLVVLFMPNFSQDLSNLIAGVNHVKALLPRIISQLVLEPSMCRCAGHPAECFAAALRHIFREARGGLAKQTKSPGGCEIFQGAVAELSELQCEPPPNSHSHEVGGSCGAPPAIDLAVVKGKAQMRQEARELDASSAVEMHFDEL